ITTHFLIPIFCPAQFGEFHTVDETDLRSPYTVKCMDVDLDGAMDVISCSSLDNKIVWYANNGQGDFSAQQIISSYPEPYTLEVADINGDNRDDIVVAGSDVSGVRVSWLENT